METPANAPPEGLVRQALEVLRKKYALKRCPRCDVDNWAAELYAMIVALPVETGATLQLGSVGKTLPPGQVPVLAMTCQNCGWLNLHSLKVLGLL